MAMRKDLNHLGVTNASVGVEIFQKLAESRIKEAQGQALVIPEWLEPPQYLTERQREMWRQAVITRGVEWFTGSDTVVLEQYVISATDLSLFRNKAVAEGWTLESEGIYRRAQRAFRQYSDMLGLNIAWRMGMSVKAKQAQPKGGRLDQIVDTAVENAQDDLLRGIDPKKLSVPDSRDFQVN
jgi:hypothetical protein